MIDDLSVYRYVRFVHNSTSKCNLAEFELSGIVMSTANVIDVTSFVSDLIFDDGLTTQTFANAVDYRKDKTPIVTSVSPKNGDVFGGYNITITGTYFDLSTPTVHIDSIECVVKTSSGTSIVC